MNGVNGIGKIALGQLVEQEDKVATEPSFNMPPMEVKHALEDQRLLGCATPANRDSDGGCRGACWQKQLIFPNICISCLLKVDWE